MKLANEETYIQTNMDLEFLKVRKGKKNVPPQALFDFVNNFCQYV